MKRLIIGLLAAIGAAGIAYASSPSDGSIPSYAVGFSSIPTAASATDIMAILNPASSGHIVHIKKIAISGLATTTTGAEFSVLKRTTADSGGTSTTRNPIPLDSSDPGSSTLAYGFTANPTLGNQVPGLIADRFVTLTPLSSGVTIAPMIIDFTAFGSRSLTLQQGEEAVVNMNAKTVSGSSVSVDIIETEE